MMFAVIYRPGAAWQPSIGFRNQPGVEAHVGFLEAQHAAGRLRLGGPFLDDAGGFCLYEAESAAALEALLATDGAVRTRLLAFELHPTAIAFEHDATANA